MDYSVLSPKAKQTYLNKLKEHCMDKVAHKMIMKKDSGRDFRKTMAKLQPEVCDMCVTNHDSNFILMTQTATLSHRTGCEYLSLFMCGNPLDAYGTQVFSSPKVKQACLHIYKQTPEEMSLKIEAFCVAGLGGV